MNDKTEFLFESDEDKAIINKAEKEIQKNRKKPYKKILLNSSILSLFIVGITIGINYYTQNEVSKLSASIAKSNNSFKEEKLNKSSNNLLYYEIDPDNKYEVIINKANTISEEDINNYKIVSVENNIYKDIKLEEQTYNSYLKLKTNLMERGYYINIRSGFRTFEDSKKIYNSYVSSNGSDYAKKYVALPGTSEHNAGLAFDFVISTDKNKISTNYSSDEYFYLENIAYIYGFIFRYPKDKEEITGYSYEPWHLRYVGEDLAKYLKKNNLTLEEYYNSK